MGEISRCTRRDREGERIHTLTPALSQGERGFENLFAKIFS